MFLYYITFPCIKVILLLIPESLRWPRIEKETISFQFFEITLEEVYKILVQTIFYLGNRV